MTKTRPSVTLFVRSLSPSGTVQQQETLLDELRRLADRGVVEDYEVHVWGERIVLDSLAAETDAGQEVLDTVEAFESWAADAGVSVDRFYEREAVESEVTGERYTARRLPMLALAEYEDGDLRMVTPHVGDDGVVTVADRLETLADQVDSGAEAALEQVA